MDDQTTYEGVCDQQRLIEMLMMHGERNVIYWIERDLRRRGYNAKARVLENALTNLSLVDKRVSI